MNTRERRGKDPFTAEVLGSSAAVTTASVTSDLTATVLSFSS